MEQVYFVGRQLLILIILMYHHTFVSRLHFRPKTPPPSPPYLEQPSDDQFPIAQDTPISIELRSDVPSGALDTFTTSEFTLGGLYGDLLPEQDSGHSLDISGDDLLNADLSLTEAQVESILSETDLKSLADDKKGLTDALEQLVQVIVSLII